MSKYKALLRNDIRHAGLDPVIMTGIFAPIALLLVTRYGFPVLFQWIHSRYAFDMAVYNSFIAAFLISIIPMMTGMMTGLLMLDERDENVIAYYAVTPLMRSGYIVYRLFLPSILCTVLSSIYIILSGISEIRLESVYTLILLTLEAPCFALFLAAFAGNKVEGLALSKLGGLFIAGPVIAYFVPGWWQLLGAWIPTYWPAKVLVIAMEDKPLTAFGFMGVGLLLHIALLSLMVKIFIKRVD